MYDGHFGYPKKFPKKTTNVIHTQTPPKTTNKPQNNQNPQKKKKKKEKKEREALRKHNN
jgi:hypothetical protein